MPERILNPIEHVFTGTGSQPITFAFSFAAALDAEALRRGLEETLALFPLARSRLQRISDTAYALQVFEAGLTFDVVKTGPTFDRRRRVEEYVTPVSTSEGEQLTRIVLVQTPRGSVLAVSMSHALVDGFSFFHFLSSWARTCRGACLLPPSMEGRAVPADSNPRAELVAAEEVLDRCGLFYGEPRGSEPVAPEDTERFLLAEQEIAELRRSIDPSHGARLTDNDLITAFLWKKYLPAWIDAAGDPAVYVTCPVDFRRIVPGFPRTYFGCALRFATASIGLDRLSRAPVGELATLVRSAVSGITAASVAASLRALEDLRCTEGLAALERIHLRHPRRGMIVTNLTRMPIGDIDFGPGPPSDFLAYAEVRGSAAILPARGGVEVLIVRP
jgi:hypothetical protein